VNITVFHPYDPTWCEPTLAIIPTVGGPCLKVGMSLFPLIRSDLIWKAWAAAQAKAGLRAVYGVGR